MQVAGAETYRAEAKMTMVVVRQVRRRGRKRAIARRLGVTCGGRELCCLILQVVVLSVTHVLVSFSYLPFILRRAGETDADL